MDDPSFLSSPKPDLLLQGKETKVNHTGQLQPVQNTAPHDTSKKVVTAQQEMYKDSDGMSAQQPHQAMGGSATLLNPQPAILVQQGQQIRANHFMQGYYPRSNVPRTIPNMSKPPMQTVVNQTGQQQTSQYSHVQVLPAPFAHGMQQVLVNPPYSQVLNYQRQFSSPPQKNIYQPPSAKAYMNNPWESFYNPQSSSNGYYPSHGIPTYNPMPPAQQMPQKPTQQQQQKKKTRKLMVIIDPRTGKNIFEGMNSEDDSSRPTAEKEIDIRAVPAPIVQINQLAPTIHHPSTNLPDVSFNDRNISYSVPFSSQETLPDSSSQMETSNQQSDIFHPSPTAETKGKKNVAKPKPKIILKYNYNEYQWSPLNPEGKRQYNRDFLLQLQSQPLSLTKPNNLPNLNIIKDKPHIQKLPERNCSYVSISNETNFHDTLSLQSSEKGCHRMPSSRKLRKKVYGILNKITSQKFETSLLELEKLNIDSEENFKVVIDLIFERAIDEPHCSASFANICKHFALMKGPAKNKQFVKRCELILNKIRQEFKKERNFEQKQKKALVKCSNKMMEEKEKEIYNEEEKEKCRRIGRTRFVGELLKLGLLSEPVIHDCIERLLTQGDEESLECLCVHLKKTGKELEEGKCEINEYKMETYFTQLQNIIEKPSTTSRLRAVLQDVIDLKKNYWVPKIEETIPKGNNQTHKESEEETCEQQVLQNISSTKEVPNDRDRKSCSDLRLRHDVRNDEQLVKKTKSLIDTFLENNNLEETIRCIKDLAFPNTIHIFISIAIDSVLKRSSQARQSFGQLLFSLIKQKIITLDQFKNGFDCLLVAKKKAPSIWHDIADILEAMLGDNEVPLTFLKYVLLSYIPSETAGVLVSATLHCAAKKKGIDKLGELWRESHLQWIDFLGETTNVEEFIRQHNLEFTITLTPTEVKKHLRQLLETAKDNEKIYDWIGANVSKTTDASFIRALVSAVYENAIRDSGNGYELHIKKLKKRLEILSQYIDNNTNLELQALYALQLLMHHLNHPRGILKQIFDHAYDHDIITEKSFKNWQQSDNIDETVGKELALHSVKSFFTSLNETDSADSN